MGKIVWLRKWIQLVLPGFEDLIQEVTYYVRTQSQITEVLWDPPGTF